MSVAEAGPKAAGRTTSGRVRELAPERKVNGSRWFVTIGVLSLLMTAYLAIAWIVSGDATRTPTGSDPVPAATKAWAIGWQIVGPLAFAAFAVYCWRRSRREGRLHIDALLLIAWTVAIWLDPATTNFFRTQMLYNSYLVNFGSWAEHIPGWLSPNARFFPEPLLSWGSLYGVTSLGATLIGCAAMHRAKRRWPNMGKVGVVLSGFAAIALADLILEVIFIRTQLYAYAGAIQSLSIWGGERHQFPVYESIIFGACWTASAALRYFRDDRGRTIVERRINEERLSPPRAAGLRFLAVTGFVTTIYVIYSLVFSLTTLWGDPFPKGYPSYMLNGMCGPGTGYACEAPAIPPSQP